MRGASPRSIQEVELPLSAARFEELRRPEGLAWLEGAYWGFLPHRFRGLVRTLEADGARSIVLISPRLVLLCFRRPRFDVGPDRGRITWPIERGALVGSQGRGHGHLRLELLRGDAGGRALLRTEVAGYRPRLASPRLGRAGAPLYSLTQLRLHEATMNAFLRSLATQA